MRHLVVYSMQDYGPLPTVRLTFFSDGKFRGYLIMDREIADNFVMNLGEKFEVADSTSPVRMQPQR